MPFDKIFEKKSLLFFLTDPLHEFQLCKCEPNILHSCNDFQQQQDAKQSFYHNHTHSCRALNINQLRFHLSSDFVYNKLKFEGLAYRIPDNFKLDVESVMSFNFFTFRINQKYLINGQFLTPIDLHLQQQGECIKVCCCSAQC